MQTLKIFLDYNQHWNLDKMNQIFLLMQDPEETTDVIVDCQTFLYETHPKDKRETVCVYMNKFNEIVIATTSWRNERPIFIAFDINLVGLKTVNSFMPSWGKLVLKEESEFYPEDGNFYIKVSN